MKILKCSGRIMALSFSYAKKLAGPYLAQPCANTVLGVIAKQHQFSA